MALINDWSLQTDQFLFVFVYFFFICVLVSICHDYCLYALYSQEVDMQSLEKHVNFENENSRKAYYREFKKVRHFKAW